MIALYVIAHAYAAAIVCAALTCAHSLARTLIAVTPRSPPSPQGAPPSESTHTTSPTIAEVHTPVLKWPRDN